MITSQNLGPVPLATDLTTQLFLYIKTLLFPPLGFLWGYRYLRQTDNRSKVIGVFVIIATFVEILWIAQASIMTYNTATQQLTEQLKTNGL